MIRLIHLVALFAGVGAALSPGALGQTHPLGEPYLFLDLNPAPGASSSPDGFWQAGGKVFFTANVPGYGRELWVTNGTPTGTYMVREIRPGPESPPWIDIVAVTVVGSRLFFEADDGETGEELWVSDGTYAGTYLVKDINPFGSSNPSDVNAINSPMSAWGTNVAFSADDGVTGRELWVSDGTEAGTYRVKDIDTGPSGSYPEWITDLNGLLLFSPDHDTYGQELWRSDGTREGTYLLRDIWPGPGSGYPGWMTELDGWMYFRAADDLFNYELWRANGSFAGTQKVMEIHPTDGSDPAGLTRHRGWIYFRAYDAYNDRELWRVNGSGYVDRVKDINPTGSSLPNSLQSVGDYLFFLANDGVHGEEPWVTDGTAEGTYMLKDINPAGDSRSAAFGRGGELYYFWADDGVHGIELWATDLTAPGTFLLADLYPGPESSYPAVGPVLGGRLLFIADDGVNGRELWAIDVEQPVIPASSTWGQLIMGLALSIAATLFLPKVAQSQKTTRAVPLLERSLIMEKQWRSNLFVGAAILGVSLPLRADPPPECGTVFGVPPEVSAPCELGPCDYALERDAWIGEQSSARKLGIDVLVHILDLEILQDPNRSARINAQLDDAKAALVLRNIELTMTPVIYDPGTHGGVASESEIYAMQSALAQNPGGQLNVYVTDVQSPLSFHARGVVPWADYATTSSGGIVIDGTYFKDGGTTLIHEIGHVFGLWHTHHGSDWGELDGHGTGCESGLECTCGCYEGLGASNCNSKGDFCCDTPATPVNLTCGDPQSQNNCDPGYWDDTDATNYMGYGLDGEAPCRTHFTTQQTRRMHCWTCDNLSAWVGGQTGACCVDTGCFVLPENCCFNRGGYFAGPDTQCGDDCNDNEIADVCEFDTGGCCSGSTCSVMAESCCDAISGSFGGHLTNCGDCNENSTPDACDIASSSSDDCNENGEPDDCEIDEYPLADCNENGTLDECEFIAKRACCFQDETCQDLTQCQCNALGGSWAILNRLCAQVQCAHYNPQP